MSWLRPSNRSARLSFPFGPWKTYSLPDPLPRHFAPLSTEFIAQARELLLFCQQFLPRRQPVGRCHHLRSQSFGHRCSHLLFSLSSNRLLSWRKLSSRPERSPRRLKSRRLGSIPHSLGIPDTSCPPARLIVKWLRHGRERAKECASSLCPRPAGGPPG